MKHAFMEPDMVRVAEGLAVMSQLNVTGGVAMSSGLTLASASAFTIAKQGTSASGLSPCSCSLSLPV
jgi:hypothetical protein